MGEYDSRSDVGDEINDGKEFSSLLSHSGRQERRAGWLNIYIAIVVTFLCILVTIDIAISSRKLIQPAATTTTSAPPSQSLNAEQAFMSAYGADRRYMSLDHKYDFLWEDYHRGDVDKVIEMDDGQHMIDIEGNDVGSPALISMWVFSFSLQFLFLTNEE